MEQDNGVNLHRTILDELADTYRRKNADYGNSFADIFAEFGMPYAVGHMAEKLARIRSLMKRKEKVTGESLRDSCMDLANYAILTLMELDKARTRELVDALPGNNVPSVSNDDGTNIEGD